MSNFQLILNTLPALMHGALITLHIAFWSTLLGLIGGSILGSLASNKIKNKISSTIIGGYVSIIQGTPSYVLILICYYALPDLMGINLSPFFAGVIALGISSTGYIAEIVRGGVNAISSDQWDASYVLGYTKIQTFLYIIWPQVIKNNLPVLTNELAILIKETAILSSIGIAEITRVAMNINAKTIKPMPIYLTVACLYFIITRSIKYLTNKIEKGLSHD